MDSFLTAIADSCVHMKTCRGISGCVSHRGQRASCCTPHLTSVVPTPQLPDMYLVIHLLFDNGRDSIVLPVTLQSTLSLSAVVSLPCFIHALSANSWVNFSYTWVLLTEVNFVLPIRILIFSSGSRPWYAKDRGCVVTTWERYRFAILSHSIFFCAHHPSRFMFILLS